MVTNSQSGVITLVDVARRAGVSSMTVSRVIHGDERVKESTRSRVKEALKALNYVPNISARNLTGSGSLRICLLYENPSSAYLGELLIGAVEAANQIGANLVIYQAGKQISCEQISDSLYHNWDAMIVPPPVSYVADLRRLVAEKKFPTVFLSSALQPGCANEIGIDDETASYQITNAILDKKHRRIGFIKGPPDHLSSELRLQGFLRALNEAGVELGPNYVQQGFYTYRSGLDAGRALLRLDPPPTAILASNDDMAAGLLVAAVHHGRLVPRDLSIAGFDDTPIATSVWPSLSTVRQPVAEMASKAVNLAWKIGKDKEQNKTSRTIVLDHKIIERDSVSVP